MREMDSLKVFSFRKYFVWETCDFLRLSVENLATIANLMATNHHAFMYLTFTGYANLCLSLLKNPQYLKKLLNSD